MSGLAGSRSWVTTAFEEARHKLTIVPVNTVFMVSRGGVNPVFWAEHKKWSAETLSESAFDATSESGYGRSPRTEKLCPRSNLQVTTSADEEAACN